MQQTLADEGIRLTQVSRATTEEGKLIYNIKHLASLENRVIS